MVAAILAISENNSIGKDNSLPWPHIQEDMDWFKEKTFNNIVVMGSNTWNSLGKRKPLKNRINVIVSSKEMQDFPGADEVVSHDLPNDILAFQSLYPNKQIFIIGGAKIYTLFAPIINIWYITRIHENYDGDTFLDIDKLLDGKQKAIEIPAKKNKPGLPKYTFEIYGSQ